MAITLASNHDKVVPLYDLRKLLHMGQWMASVQNGKNIEENFNRMSMMSEPYRHRRFGAVGSDVGQINEVTLRRARLVLGWVTVCGFNFSCGKFISV